MTYEGADHMRDDNKNDSINELLILYLRNMSHTIHSLYERKGSQKRILVLLKENGPLIQRESTKKLGIRASSVSKVIAKLDNTELIKRTINQSDRKTTNITLTKSGKQSIQEVWQRQNSHKEMFSSLSFEEKNQLIFFLEKINNDWKKNQPLKKGTII